jgi:DNA-binding XRE family transcriptional regulator
MFMGRWNIEDGNPLTIRQLALLARMKEAAVRNALSKERIAIESGKVDPETALAWLRQRRDFVPTRKDEANRERWARSCQSALENQDFGTAFTAMLRDFPMTREALAAKAEVDEEFIDALLAGRPIPDLERLRSVGEALDLDAPHFAGAAVRAVLEAGA